MATVQVLKTASGSLTVVDETADSAEFYSLGLGATAPSAIGTMALDDSVGLGAYIDLTNGDNAAAAPANHGRIVYDVGDQEFKMSANGAGFQPIPTGSTTDVTITDNSTNAWRVRESTNEYFNVNTTDGSENITIGGASIAVVDVLLPDNKAAAFQLREDGNDYINVDTTNGGEQIVFANATNNPDVLIEGTGAVLFDGDLAAEASIYPTQDSASGSAGRALKVYGGQGGDGSDPGVDGGVGAAVAIQAGAGGAGTGSQAAGAGGAATVQGGAGGTDNTGGGAVGGNAQLIAGAGSGSAGGGDVDINGGAGGVGPDGDVNIGASNTGKMNVGCALQFTGTTIDLDPTGSFTLDMDASQVVTITVADNQASAFLVKEGSNNYFDVDTSNGSEQVTFGNATTNPDVTLAGTGSLVVGGDVRGPNDGSGVLIGHAGAGASEGSALQVISLTTTERGYLTGADGMIIYNSTTAQFEGYSSGWSALSGGGSTTDITISDNTTDAWRVREATNEYFNVDTTDGSEQITIGNTTTDPDVFIDSAGDLRFNGQVGGTATIYVDQNSTGSATGRPVNFGAGAGGDASGATAGAGGFISVEGAIGGDGDATYAGGTGGGANLWGGWGGGDGGAGGGAGGSAQVAGGNAQGNSNGGHALIQGGGGSGSGTDGQVRIGWIDTSVTYIGPTSTARNASFFVVRDAAENYIEVDSSTGSERITFGNSTTNPDIFIAASCDVLFDGDVAGTAIIGPTKDSAGSSTGRSFSTFGGEGGDASGATAGGGGQVIMEGGLGGAGDGTFAGGVGGTASVWGGWGGSDGGGGGGAGGSVEIIGGRAQGNSNGGNVLMHAGQGAGAGSHGNVQIGRINTTETVIGAVSTAVNASFFRVRDATENYIEVDSSAGSEVINFGNATDNPDVTIVGTGSLIVGGDVRGPNDGTGIVVGHAGAGASEGSALQVISMTTTQQGYLVGANGMIVYNSTTGQFEGYNGSWSALGGDATDITITDNTTNAWRVRESTNEYFNVNTTDGSEQITLGNGTTDPSVLIDGTGDLNFNGEEAGAAYIRPTQRASESAQGRVLWLYGGAGGDSAGTGIGGDGNYLALYGGPGGANALGQGAGDGGDVIVRGGSGGTQNGGNAGGIGGDARLEGGQATAGSATAVDGGDARVRGGQGYSGGANGDVIIGASTTAAVTIGNATDNTTITQTGTGQVTFTGNVDANNGLDVDGVLTVVEGTGNTASIDLTDGDSATASAANHGKIRYNETTDKIEKSENTGAYVPINAPDSSIVDDATTTTTTSPTYTQMANMTATPVAGTYLVHFSGSLQHDTNNTASAISIYSAGAIVSASERAFRRGNQDIYVPFHTMAIVTVNGAQAIQGEWRTDAGTLTCYEHQLMYQRVA